MTQEKWEFERDLEPRSNGKSSVWELLVPMHADNFALALAAGYVGGSLKNDAAQDLQSSAGDGLIGFNAEVPVWAILEGESGDRVLLCVERHGEEEPRPGSAEMLVGPMRVTSLQRAYFKDGASLANFNASYEAFPDVPIGIVKLATKWPVSDERERPGNMQANPVDLARRRQELDFICGFAAGLVELLAEDTFDDAICRFLQKSGSNLADNAQNLLLSLEPRSSQVDIAIWRATMEALRSRFSRRGFDRRELLAEVEKRLANHGPEVNSWVRGCQKVIDAEIDIPSLADGAKIGRRAALAIMLSYEPSGLKELESSFQTGPRVRALITAAVYAFAGLSRIDERLKSPASRMDAVLEIGEHLAAGDSVLVEIATFRMDDKLTRYQTVKVAGNWVLDREIELPAHMRMLKTHIHEAGYQIELDSTSGKMGIRSGATRGDFIVVENCPRSTPGNLIVNLVLPIATLGSRPTVASLKKLMSAAFDHGTIVALRVVGEKEEVVTMASLPLAQLDRDELSFHVERLLQLSTSLRGKQRKGRPVKTLRS